MKKLSLILLAAIILLTGSCNTWMQDDGFYSDIENDVKVANAKQISVYVRYALTRQGKTDPDGTATFKVEIPQEISAITEPEYGFVRWAAFSTDFLATGDNQSKNKDIYFIDDEDYNNRILPHEIQSPIVVFEDATKPTTEVRINEERNDIYLCPIVAQRPTISLTIPAKGSSGVVRNMSVRINFSKPMDPDSFMNEAGEYDKITVTQGIQSFTADGDIDISSEDITDRFEAPTFSKNQKMITLKFKPEAISEGYAAQSSVNITISKDVKDTYGYSMADDDKISFSVGSYMDTLAPRITQLTAGRGATDFHAFKGMYKDAATGDLLGNYTKMRPQITGATPAENVWLGVTSAPGDINASFYDTLIPYRITGKVILRVFAEDIAGSGSNQDQTGIETDVAMLGLRAYHLFDKDGNASTLEIPLSGMQYQPQMNLAPSLSGAYKNLVDAVNNSIPGTDNDLDNNKGCLIEYDVSSLPDGLIRIDVAAVDMVQNSGFTDGGALSEEYGNGYASIYVVKDTTKPNALSNANYAVPDLTHASADGHYFNANNYAAYVKINGDTSSIADDGHSRLRSPHDLMKWIVRPTADTNWINEVSAASSEWRPVTSDYFPFPIPGNQGEVHYTFALMDDMGNISTAVGIPAINYDSVAPVVQALSLVADEGYTSGSAKGNILDHQTLVIPVTEQTSGVKKIEVHIKKDGTNEEYATPFAAGASGITVTVGGASVPFTVSGKTLTLSSRQPNFNSNITIKGLKISDATTDDALQDGYSINVTVSDDAANPTSTSGVQGSRVSIDSVAPVINKIYIPNLKQTVRFGGNTPEWWIDYNAAPINTTGTAPTTEVYVKFTEASSGAKIFDFAGSSIHLTAESQIFQIDPTTAAATSGAIDCTVDTANNRLTINSSENAGNYFAGGVRAAKITNVQLAPAPASSTVALKIHDVATNVAENASSQISSKEGSVDFASDPSPITTTNFGYDPATPSSATPHGSLADRVTEITDLSAALDAELGWTNNSYIKATVSLTPSAAGIDSLTIIGDAIFDTTSSTPTTITVGGASAYFDVSADGKTVVFKVSPTDPSHTVLGTGATPLSILIDNLKLTGTDGLKTITFKARSFGSLTDPTGSSDTIILDTTAPVWVEAAVNHQFYSGTDPVNPALTPAEATYPHPVTGGKAYGITFPSDPSDTNLYFYTSVGSSQSYTIYPNYDPNDATLKDEGVRVSFSPTGSTASTGSWFTRTGDVTNTTVTCYIRDRAGNKSLPQTFKVIKDDVFASSTEEAAIDNYMTLYIPAGAKLHRNSAVTQTGYLESDLYNGGSAITSTRQAYNYVFKGAAATEANSAYEIKVKLATGVASTDTDKLLDGSDPTAQSAYNRRLVTTTSSPIEYFAVSHWYNPNDTTGFTPVDPTTISRGSWNQYTPSSPDYTNGDITSSVDSSENIVIKVLNKNCPPLTLYLKDGCGNITYRKIKPASMTGDLAWVVDTGIGLSGQAVYTQSYTSSATNSIKLPVNTSSADTNFYNSGAKVTFTGCSDSCFFEGASGEVTDATEIANNSFTLKSRVIMWSGTEAPTLENFNSPALSASTWKYYRKASADAATPTFSMEHSLPYSSTLPASKADPYTLWLVLVDTVGNYEAKPLKWTSNSYTTKNQYWCYDVEKPAATAGTPTKVNNIDNKNYYSSNSSVPYTISDYQSGLRYDGNYTNSWTTFENRSVALNRTYSLSSALPKTSTGGTLSGTTVSGYLPLPYIRDFANNIRPGTGDTSTGTPEGLVWQGANQWVRQADAPTWITHTVQEDVEGVATNFEKYHIDATTGNGTTGNLWRTPSNDIYSTDNDPIDYKIRSGRNNTSIKVNLRVDSNNWSGHKEPLLGFIITNSEKSSSSFQSFYSTADFSDTSYGAYDIHTTANDSRLTYNPNPSSDYYTYTYTFTKTDTNKAWHTEVPDAYYFYPVSRSGLVCKKPVKVYFDKNPVPSITEGSITYSGVNHYAETATSDKNVTVGSSNNVNYTKSGSYLYFKVDSDSAAPSWYPTDCAILWTDSSGNQSHSFILTSAASYHATGWSATNLVYKIPLSGFTDLNALTDKSLKIKIYSREGNSTSGTIIESSNEYALNGPAGNNKWTYDNTRPSISFTESSIKSVNYPNSGSTTTAPTYNNRKYIQSPTVRITADASDSSGTGIERYQWQYRTYIKSASETYSWGSWSAWTDIPASYLTSTTSTSAVFEWPAPENQTEYYFRVIDKANNISSQSYYSSSATTYNTVTLQHDEWAPAVPASENNGLIDYKLYNGTTEKTKANFNGTNGNSLITESGTGDSAAVEIKYSSTSAYQSPNYINKIVFDFSKVTDNVDADGNASLTGIQRSGFDITDSTNGSDIMVSIDGAAAISIDSSAAATAGFNDFNTSTKLLTLSLPAGSNTPKTYAFTVKDNIGNSRTLRTFTLKPDGRAPVLRNMNVYADEGLTNQAVTVDSDSLSDVTRYLKGSKAVVKYTITNSDVTDPTAYYYWAATDSDSAPVAASYAPSQHSEVTSTSSTVIYTFDAPESKKYYWFKAIDEVGNTIGGTSAYRIKLQRDEWAPTGTLAYSTNYDSTERNLEAAGINTAYPENSANSRLIKYSSTPISPYFINKIDLDLNPITDKVNNTERAGIKYFQVIKESSTDLAFTSPTQESDIKIWDRTSGYDLPETAGANDTKIDSSRHYQLDLSGNDPGTYYRYTIKVYDNISYNTTLYTFITQSDNQKPAFPQPAEADIQATEEDGTNSSNSVKYNGIFYLKNDRAVVSFTQSDESDANAHYRWSNDNSHWYEYNATSSLWEQYELNTSTNTYVKSSPDVTLPGSTASITRNTTNHKISFSFAAPDTATIYYFMAEDLVGNREIRGAPNGDTCIKLQKDKWAPAVPATENGGLIGYTLYNGSNSKTLTAGLETTGTDSNGNPTVEIKYSSNSEESGSANHITKIRIDVSNVTDTVNGIDRSGIENFYVNGTAVSSIKTNGYYDITLTNGATAQSSYIISVKDNAGNDEKILRTFILKPNADLPDFDLAGTTGTTTRVMKSEAADGSSASSCDAKTTSTTNEVYYLNKDYAVINFTKTHEDITSYQVSTDDGSTWAPITTTTDTSNATHTVSYVLATPTESTTYKFKAVDDVLNETVISTTITLQKDTADPINDVTYSFKKEEPAGTVSAAIGNTYYIDNADATATTRPIIYNADEINRFELDLSPISDATSGIRRFWLQIDSSEIELTNSTTPAISSNKCLITLATADNTTQTYVISAEDWAGNKRTVKTFTLTSDAAGPDFTMGDIQAIDASNNAVTGGVWQDATSGTYYLRGEKAKFNFTKTGTDIVKYEVKAVTGGTGDYTEIPQTVGENPNPDLSISDTAVAYQFTAPEAVTTYTFKFTDRVGHVQEMTTDAKTLVKDVTAPALAESQALTFRILNASDTEATAVSDTILSGDYVLSTEGTTTTITYNPAVVKKIVFDDLSAKFAEYATSGANSGFDRLYYQSSSGNPHDMDSNNDGVNQIDFSSEWTTTKTYSIYASDKAGNKSEALMTFVLTADGTAPKLGDDAEPIVKVVDGRNIVKGYNARKPNSEGGYENIGTMPYAQISKIGNNQKTNYYTVGTQLIFGKDDLPDAVQYKIVQTVTTVDADGYNASADNNTYSWETMTADGDNYVFTLPNVTVLHTRLALFFKDSVGNVSSAYYLGNNGTGDNDYGIAWWFIPTELSASDVSISTVTVYNDTSKVNWQGTKTNYLASIKLPKFALVKTLAFAPAQNGDNTGVVIGEPSGAKDQIFFTNHSPKNKSVTALSESINLVESTEVGLQVLFYVHEKVNGVDIPRSDVKIIINGFEYPLFPEGGYSNITSTGTGGFISDIASKLSGNNDSDEYAAPQRSTPTFFEKVTNIFTHEAAPASDAAASNKKTSKKAKKAKKAAKVTSAVTEAREISSSKFADENLVSSQSERLEATTTVTAPTSAMVAPKSMMVESTSAVVEPASVVVEPASAVVEPVETTISETDSSKEFSSSKTAVIVVMLTMLAALSGLAGSLYALKRKKK